MNLAGRATHHDSNTVSDEANGRPFHDRTRPLHKDMVPSPLFWRLPLSRSDTFDSRITGESSR